MNKLFRLITTILVIFPTGAAFWSGVRAEVQLSNISESDSADHLTKVNLTASPPGIQIVASNSVSIVLDLTLPPFQVDRASANSRSCQTLGVENYSRGDISGEPDLPFTGTLVGIPLDSTPFIKILSQESEILPGQFSVCPAASPVISQDLLGNTSSRGENLTGNTAFYSKDEFSPSQPVELVSTGMIRSQRVARLRFSPFQYNPVSGELRAFKHLRVQLYFNANQVINTSAVQSIDEGPFEAVLAQTLINYDQALSWRSRIQSTPLFESSPLSTKDLPAYKIQINQDGLYQVTYSDLQSAGASVASIDPRTFRLFNQGVEVAILVSGEEDGIFDSRDILYFYAQKINTKYTDTNVYWLSWGSMNGLRMASRDGSVSGNALPAADFNTSLHLEENHVYMSDDPSGPQNDHWYWSLINANSAPAAQDFTFQLHNLANADLTARVKGLFKGYAADPQHHTRIYLNGSLLDDKTWPSDSEYAFSIDLPQSDLLEGTNTFTVELPRDNGISFDLVIANWFEVEYFHSFSAEADRIAFSADAPGLWNFGIAGFTSGAIDVLDITNPLAPVRITGSEIVSVVPLFSVSFDQQISQAHQYLVISALQAKSPLSISLADAPSLQSLTNAADYIIISYPDFLAAVQPLADYHASKGLRVKVVNVQDIYDEFNGGVFDPQAIQTFLAYTYLNWVSPAPAYVLLVGDGHYDFKDDYRGSGPEYIPPFLGEFDPWIGETAADNRYVTVSGSDNLPDMAIGRLPVNNAAETTVMVNKLLSYEQDPLVSDWNTHLAFVADNTDPAGNFPLQSDAIADHYLSPEFNVEKIYYGITYTNISDMKAAVSNAINQGQLIVNYTGHGSTQLWASEQIFDTSSLASLTNTNKYPLFVPMTCGEGYFIFPKATGWDYPSLAETLVRADKKGAIASFSPSGFGLASSHDLLSQGLYKAIFINGTTQFGPATTFAKYFLYANSSGYNDLIDTYNLFGDPAARLRTNSADAKTYSIDLPVIRR